MTWSSLNLAGACLSSSLRAAKVDPTAPRRLGADAGRAAAKALARGSLTAMLLGILTGASGAAAAQEGPLTITLQEAMARAEQQSLRLAELGARAEAAGAAAAGRAAAGRPTIAIAGGYTRTNHVDEYVIATPDQPVRVLYPDVPDNYRARLGLDWPIYTAGRVAALERAATAEHAATVLDLTAAAADARLEAARAFWALVTARETEAVLVQALAGSDAHVNDLRSRLEQGLIPPNDLLSAEAQRSRQRLLAIEARTLRGIAEADLHRVIGDDSHRPIHPVAPPSTGEAPPGDDWRALTTEARHRRSERRAFEQRRAAARERETAAAAAGRPQISLDAGYDYARPNPRIFPRLDLWHDSWDVAVNVRWTIWDGGRRHAEQAEAAAATRVVETRAADFDRQLAFEVEQRRLELESASAAIATADEGVGAAVEARRVVGERFGVGVATSTDVLDADTAVLQAQLDRTRALAGARLAAARLDRAVGRSSSGSALPPAGHAPPGSPAGR